jgi:hypothetical protein
MRRYGWLVSSIRSSAVMLVPLAGVAGVNTVGCGFDGDADLAVGVSGETLRARWAGAVNTIYGSLGC